MSDTKPGSAKAENETPAPPATPAEAEAPVPAKKPAEIGGPKGPEPTRFGDWERQGRCVDF